MADGKKRRLRKISNNEKELNLKYWYISTLVREIKNQQNECLQY